MWISLLKKLVGIVVMIRHQQQESTNVQQKTNHRRGITNNTSEQQYTSATTHPHSTSTWGFESFIYLEEASLTPIINRSSITKDELSWCDVLGWKLASKIIQFEIKQENEINLSCHGKCALPKTIFLLSFTGTFFLLPCLFYLNLIQLCSWM